MEYTKSDVANVLKKRPRTIKYWTDIGLVIPDIEPSQERGRLVFIRTGTWLSCHN